MRRITMLLLALSVIPFSYAGEKGDDYLDRMSVEHAGDSPVGSPAAAEASAGEVETSRVVYATVGDKPITGFLAKPAGRKDGGPAMIVIHEWWGLNENIESMAKQLAGQGYTALAVDLYGVEAATTPEGARELAGGVRDDPGPAEENLQQAFAYLEREHGASKVGSIGWCFGGGFSLRTALLLPDKLDAAVIYYGRLVTDRETLAGLTAPVLGHFGSEDRGIPIDTVREFEAALKALGKQGTVHVYEGANHAFANPSGTRYDAEAAETAWKRTLEFLREHLQSPG